jgi:hypothetical protein
VIHLKCKFVEIKALNVPVYCCDLFTSGSIVVPVNAYRRNLPQKIIVVKIFYFDLCVVYFLNHLYKETT